MAMQRHDQGVKKRRTRQLAEGHRMTQRQLRARHRAEREAERFAADWHGTTSHPDSSGRPGQPAPPNRAARRAAERATGPAGQAARAGDRRPEMVRT